MKSDTRTDTKAVRVLLADYPALTRHALRHLIEAGDSFRVIAEAATIDEAAEHARRSTVDVIAIDFGMPGFSDLDTLPWRGRPDAPETVVIARHYGIADLDRALHMGACGYLTKNDDADVLYLALREAVSGRSFLSPHVTRAVLDSLVPRYSAPPDTATSVHVSASAAARGADAEQG